MELLENNVEEYIEPVIVDSGSTRGGEWIQVVVVIRVVRLKLWIVKKILLFLMEIVIIKVKVVNNSSSNVPIIVDNDEKPREFGNGW